MPKRILVVEDDAKLRRNLEVLLSGEGYEVGVAESGETALEIAARNLPDAIVCDIMLPGFDGVELVRRLRASDRAATVPVIFLTARADRETHRIGMNAGGDDYITKPFTAQELLSSLSARLERSHLLSDRIRSRQEEMEERYSLIPNEAVVPLSKILAMTDTLIDGASADGPHWIYAVAVDLRASVEDLMRFFDQTADRAPLNDGD
jgi:DNA-binding response OmpR family regulator